MTPTLSFPDGPAQKAELLAVYGAAIEKLQQENDELREALTSITAAYPNLEEMWYAKIEAEKLLNATPHE